MKFNSSVLMITTGVSCISTLQSCINEIDEEPKITENEIEIFLNPTSFRSNFNHKRGFT